MERVAGKVAVVTGAGRGMGRSHAVRLAEEGADIIAIDLPGETDIARFHDVATPADLEETGSLVRALGRRIVVAEVDVRDRDAVKGAIEAGVDELGRLDIVVANAGVFTHGLAHELTAETWQRTIDVDLTGVWNTTSAGTPHLIAAGGGSMILISSMAGLMGNAGIGAYAAAKHGVVGLMRSLAIELGEYWIRVNSVHPGNVATPILLNDSLYRRFRPDLETPTLEDVKPAFQAMNVLPSPFAQPEDVSNAVLFLASDESRSVTGLRLTVDLGASIKGARLMAPAT